MSTAESLADTSPMMGEEYRRDPLATIARLRREDPVHRLDPLPLWSVLRYDDVRMLFADERVTPDRRAMAGYVPPEGEYMRWLSENGLFSAPPEQHARLRGLVSKALTPRAVKRMEGQVREVVEQFAAPLRGRRGPVELAAAYTDPIPNTVICRITGVPPNGDDEARFRALMRDIISAISPLLDDEGRRRSEAAMLELTGYIEQLCEARRREPAEDLVTDLLQTHEGSDHMSDREIVLMIAGLVAAGTETTAIGGMLGIKNLLQHPDQLAELRADRSLLPNAVRELLRYDFGTGGGIPRYALCDFELRGKKIRKGDMLMLNFTGAHRDPEAFPDPDRFDIRRDTRNLIIFGRGAHFCLGANLAQRELTFILDAALDFLPENARLIEDQIEYSEIMLFKRQETLPVDFG